MIGYGIRAQVHDLTTHTHTALWVSGARTDTVGCWRSALAKPESADGWRLVVDVVTRDGATGEVMRVVAPGE